MRADHTGVLAPTPLWPTFTLGTAPFQELTGPRNPHLVGGY